MPCVQSWAPLIGSTIQIVTVLSSVTDGVEHTMYLGPTQGLHSPNSSGSCWTTCGDAVEPVKTAEGATGENIGENPLVTGKKRQSHPYSPRNRSEESLQATARKISACNDQTMGALQQNECSLIPIASGWSRPSGAFRSRWENRSDTSARSLNVGGWRAQR